ncbi:hypothetical protein [Leptolyngbya sp. 7M]|uniref:hypothetical protein n=1 Tax=Leptolyngbya sp. 7M TaxID=2812896 RepID=UPI001B8C2F82|nr:hypothetical protein [Leptolyngbya sp. 7M]QYO62754.1 hypothetical protein JVX88_22350 [Leptolyngbya sp. 7M]
MKKFIALVLGLALAFSLPLPATAAFCRIIGGQTICILEIKRSAKNYWEYRAAVKVNDEERPIEIYNCREQIRVRQDGITVPFQPNGAGELICRVLNRARQS